MALVVAPVNHELHHAFHHIFHGYYERAVKTSALSNLIIFISISKEEVERNAKKNSRPDFVFYFLKKYIFF